MQEIQERKMLEHLEINAQKRKNMQQNTRLSEGT